MIKTRKLKKCMHPHFCREWDYIFITPQYPEFKSCICVCTIRKDCKMKQFAESTLRPFELKMLIKWRKSL